MLLELEPKTTANYSIYKNLTLLMRQTQYFDIALE